VEYIVPDTLCCMPIGACGGFAQGLVTFGSPDFMAFLLSYFVQSVGFPFVTRIYLDWLIGGFYELFFAPIFRGITWVLEKIMPTYMKKDKKAMEEEEDARRREVEGLQDADDSESVEPILDAYAGVSQDTCINCYTPFFIYLFMQYRDQIGIPNIYGIRQSDMMIYLLFQLSVLLFQPFVDILIHAQVELFHGFKIYEYLVYARYRFLQRESRWKGMEDTLDECIEEGLRRLDQMCFSSQYYLMVTVHFNGLIYLILGFECWIRVQYSPFADSGFPLIMVILIAAYIGLEYALLFFAYHGKLWKIKHENTAWHLAQGEEDDIDVPGWEEVRGASHEAYLMNQRITSETFRYKFLNYNRSWLINQLPNILTPRTMRRSRPYLINQFARIINSRKGDFSDDSDAEKEDRKFGPVALSASSRNIIRWWLGKAKRRLQLKDIVDPLIRRARGAECEQCLSRKQLQVEYDVDIEKMMAMYDKAYPDEVEIDQVQWKSFWSSNQRYHTICLACLTKRKETETKNAIRAAAGGFDAGIFDTTPEEYPDWGPVYLSAASKAILLNWYRKAQRIRQGKRGAKKRDKIVIT